MNIFNLVSGAAKCDGPAPRKVADSGKFQYALSRRQRVADEPSFSRVPSDGRLKGPGSEHERNRFISSAHRFRDLFRSTKNFFPLQSAVGQTTFPSGSRLLSDRCNSYIYGLFHKSSFPYTAPGFSICFPFVVIRVPSAFHRPRSNRFRRIVVLRYTFSFSGLCPF